MTHGIVARSSPRSGLPALSEREFQAQVTDLAHLLGWTSYHAWLSVHSPRGWPDLALCRPPRLILAELKREKAALSPSQERWLALLRDCPGVETHVWRPSDWPEIETTLR